jgi:hypothetical protein
MKNSKKYVCLGFILIMVCVYIPKTQSAKSHGQTKLIVSDQDKQALENVLKHVYKSINDLTERLIQNENENSPLYHKLKTREIDNIQQQKEFFTGIIKRVNSMYLGEIPVDLYQIINTLRHMQ